MSVDCNVNARIKELCEERGFSYYELAKRSEIPYSTLNTMMLKENQPSLPTLKKLCNGFGITLLQFFNSCIYITIYRHFKLPILYFRYSIFLNYILCIVKILDE